MRGGEKLLIHSEQGVDSPTPLPSFFLLPGDAETLRSLPLTDSSSLVCFLSLFSQPCHLSPSLTPACHFHFFSPPSLSPSISQQALSLLHPRSLVISLTVHALSTVKAVCYQQRHTQTHPHTDQNWLLQTMFYSLSLLLPLLPLSPTDNEISSDAVILLMSFTSHQKE